MHSLQDIREAYAAKQPEYQALVAKTKLTADERTQYDTLHNELIELRDQQARRIAANELTVEQGERSRLVDAAQRVGTDKKSDASRALALYLSKPANALTSEEVVFIRNTMSTTTQSEGGYVVDPEIATKLTVAMKKYGAMRAVSTIIQMASGNAMNFPVSDPTSELGEIVGENVQTSQLDTALQTVALNVFKYSSKQFAVPIELLEDAVIDIAGYIFTVAGMRLGRIQNLHFTQGSGVNQPQGIVTAVSAGYTCANANAEVAAVKGDSLIELRHSVDPAYRELGNCGWMMNDASLKVISKLKDNNARYMFVPGFEQGTPQNAPDTLLGYKVVINQQMPVMAAGARSILFGDFSFYTIREAMAPIIKRFDDSPFALKGQVGFCGWARAGGNLVDIGGAVKALVNAAA